MASYNHQQNAFPAVPPSNSAGDHGMRDYYADSSAPRPPPNHAPYLTPYLGLRARLSQIWINRWTVLLLLVLVRVLFAIADTNDGLRSARGEALSACTSVEKMGSVMASMPHYMALGVNRMTARSVEKAVSGLQSGVMLSVAAIEEIVVFVIGMMTNTYLCLITLVVSGSLHAAVDVLMQAQQDINKVLGGIGDDVGNVANGLASAIQGITDKVNTFFGGTPPKVDFTKQIDAIKNVKIPDTLTDDLKKLNSSIPTFQDVKNVTETVIRFPFEELKKTISGAWGKYTFNDSVFPVPRKEALNFCSQSNGINDFFDGLDKLAHTLKRAFIGFLVVAAILACLPMAWWEIKRYRRLQERSRTAHVDGTDQMDIAYILSRPYTAGAGLWAAKKFNTSRRQILVRWCISYFTSVPALFLLSLAIAGLFSCLCQYIILRSIEKEVPNLTGQVANFSAKVVAQLNNASVQWADGSNKVILAESDKLNKDLLGWVNISTVAVNNTLNKFIDETTKVLDTAFKGTPLYDPVKGVFECLIGLKVASFQKGLTWVHDNAHINFPLLNNDTFSLTALAQKSDSTSDDSFLADPGTKTRDEVSGAILKVTDHLRNGIRQEAIISTMILVAYLAILFGGIAYTAWKLYKVDKVRGEAGNEYNGNGLGLATTEYGVAVPYQYAGNGANLGPAPAYSKSPDVNAAAPYTLNHHPGPRPSDETLRDAGNRHSIGPAGPIVEPSRVKYTNEKGNFI